MEALKNKQATSADETEARELPTTGSKNLDQLLDHQVLEFSAGLYTAMEIERADPDLGKRIYARVKAKTEQIIIERRDGQLAVGDDEFDSFQQFIDFLDGYRTAKQSVVAKDEKDKASETRPFSPDKAGPEIRALADWMANRSFECSLYGFLSHKLHELEGTYKREGFYDGDIGNDIYNTCREDVIKAIENPPAGIDPVVLSMTAALLPLYD